MAERFAGAEAVARQLPQACAAMAAARGIAFLDLQPVVSPSPVDGLHFDAVGHRLIGGAVAEALQALCGRS
jgi:lysophospholipase L1-like esterase